MLLSEFNQASPSSIKECLLHCVHIERWANEIIMHRPFVSIEALISFANLQAKTWSWEEILLALNTHPRIGEKKAQQQLSEKEITFSDHEQSMVSQDQEILDEILKANIAYEKRFGYIFLIKATGLNSEEILTALNYRLLNDSEMEKRIVHQQLLDIALLRLVQEIQSDECPFS